MSRIFTTQKRLYELVEFKERNYMTEKDKKIKIRGSGIGFNDSYEQMIKRYISLIEKIMEKEISINITKL